VAGAEASLPDGRQYEMVSPPNKDGARVFGIIGGGAQSEVIGGAAATQAAEDGNGMTYITSAPAGEGAAGNVYSSQILSTRGPEGWLSKDIAAPTPIPPTLAYGFGEAYRLFSSDLSQAVLQDQFTEPPLAPEVKEDSVDANEIYLRNNFTGTFRALVGEPLPPYPDFLGTTPDFSHLLFATQDGSGAINDWSNGQTRPVNILPNKQVENTAWLGGGFNNGEFPVTSEFIGRHAISTDGRRIVWGNAEELFSRDMTSEETVQLDAAQGGKEGGGGYFQAASSNGKRVFFDDQNELVAGVSGGGLYMYDFEAPEGAPKLTDLTPGAGAPVVLGANEQGTSLYLLSRDTIELLREAPLGSGSWHITPVATLGAGDSQAYHPQNLGAHHNFLDNWPVRVSPNGQYLAFMSNQSLTGYDNRDVNSGVPDEEVYLYGAEANRLACVSCNPTGARPAGDYDIGEAATLPMDETKTWGKDSSNKTSHTLAAAIPGWNEKPAFYRRDNQAPLYASRVLSNEGRLFFDSADALVPQDVNGREDVYQYEPAKGVAEAPVNNTCTTESSTYSARSSGCVSLISGGSGRGDSDFVDASANGNDVFFVTTDPLAPQDKGTERDMYDAHVCTGEAPCYPTQAALSPPCASADGCRVARTPQPGVFGSPPSATFSGVGNVTPTAAKPTVTSPTRAKKLARALKTCRRHRSRKARNSCEKLARQRYGPLKANRAGTKRRAQ
jgi:hypothetical protein